MARLVSRILHGHRPVARRIVAPTVWAKVPIEEQTLPGYRPHTYYPVSLGQVLNERYAVIAKLGFGSTSTVWLAQDVQRWKWQRRKYVVLKMLTNNAARDSMINSELKISDCVKTADRRHEGLRYLRTVVDSFEVRGPGGKHLGLVYRPMRETLSTFQRRVRGRRIPSYLLKPLLTIVLTGLDYLHTKCFVIHTDLKPDNIMLGFENQAVIDDLVNEEATNPCPRKADGDGFIYPTRNFGDLQGAPGRPKIADFGLAVWGNVSQLHNHPIQADLFRAPEVILRAGWTYSADIWNLGVMRWDLMENQTLFDPMDPATGVYDPHAHLAEMNSLLGPPPLELLTRGKGASEYFTDEGQLLHAVSPTANSPTFETSVTAMTGEDKRLFLEFVSRMLRWMPEQRATAGELLQDPWLKE